MTIALDRPLPTVDRPQAPSRAGRVQDITTARSARAPFSAPGPRVEQPTTSTVELTLTVTLAPGTSDVEAARVADALRSQAARITAGRRAGTAVRISSPHPFTAAGSTSTASPTRIGPRARRGAAASPVRERRPGVVSPSSPARRDIEAARLRTLQATAVSPSAPARAGESSLVLDLYGRRLRIDGADIDLTFKEFELLAHLAAHARTIVTRDDLMASVWADADADTGERTVDVHIRRLRTKLGRYRRLISTVRGAGYRLDPGSDVSILG